jgi:hypothetical protein
MGRPWPTARCSWLLSSAKNPTDCLLLMQAAVELLSAQLLELEGVRQQLEGEEIPALTEDLARLNDTHILAVSRLIYVLLGLLSILI